ncbi:transposon ty3-I gag-pol polyprotein [Tanacetum coccineum]
MPTQTNNNTNSKPLAIKWISPVERQERLNKRLCFNCDNKWIWGHKCPGKFLLLMGDDEQDTEPKTEPNIADAVESGVISILNSLIRQGSPRSLQLWGSIGSGTVHVLIDNGSTHNCVRPDIMEKIQLPVQSTKAFKVYIGSGESLLCESLCSQVMLSINSASIHHMHALLESDDVYGIYELYNVTKEAQEVPTSLPPHRTIDHRIHLLPNTKPVSVRPYRYPQYQKGEMEKLVNEMLEQGIIRFTQSPFSSHVLLVKKKDRSYRFCVDYRALNEVTVKDKFPILTVDEMFDELGGAVIFTKLDLRAGYHQIRVHERDIYQTAFRTHDGHYEFLVMPFGLTNALSTFQATMNQLFSPYLRKFEHQFYVKRSKYAFGASTLEYLGHIIFGRFIRGYATTATPLTNLLRKGEFKWGEPEPKAFEDLKLQISTTPVLSLPDFEKIFIIETDSADEDIEAVLLQEGHPICYFSRRLGPRMKATVTYEKELFAIVEAVFKWRHYLLGRRFVIRTDHKSLKELMQQVIQTPVQHRSGHGGVKKMMASLAAMFYWKGMRKSVEEYIKNYRDVTMDFITGMPLSKGFTVVLVVVDRFSKYAHFALFPTTFNAPKVAEVFVETVVKLHVIPKSIVSDPDPVYVSKFWTQLFKLSGTQLNHSTTYHPQTDGQTEVVNRGLEQYLRAMVEDRPTHWVRFLPWAEYCYNTTYHSSIKMTPYQALYGKVPLVIISYPPGSSKVAAVDDSLVERDALLRLLRQNPLAAKNRMEEKANRKRRDVEFALGDQVLVKLQPYRQITLARRLSNKLAKRYYGPYEILERVGKVAYRLALPADSKIHPVFHVSILKPFVGDNVCEVTKLPEEWVDRSPEDATWEALTEFQSAYPGYDLGDKVIFEERGMIHQKLILQDQDDMFESDRIGLQV